MKKKELRYVLEYQKGMIKKRFTSDDYMTLIKEACKVISGHVYLLPLFLRVYDNETKAEILKFAYDKPTNIITGADVVTINSWLDFANGLKDIIKKLPK